MLKNLWFDCQWDKSPQETKMTQQLTAKGHRTVFNNDESPYRQVSDKMPRNHKCKTIQTRKSDLFRSPNSIFCLFVFYVDTFLLFSSSYTRSVLQRMSGRAVFNYYIGTVIHYTYDTISCCSKFDIFFYCLFVSFISNWSYRT